MRELTLEEVDAVSGGNYVVAATAVALAGMALAVYGGCDFSFSSSGIRMTCLAQ